MTVSIIKCKAFRVYPIYLTLSMLQPFEADFHTNKAQAIMHVSGRKGPKKNQEDDISHSEL